MNAKKELLKVNNKALQGLHHLIGYDFQQPHTIIKHEGKFTYKSIINQIENPKDQEISLLIRTIPNKNNFSSIYDTLHIITIDQTGKIQTEYKHGYKYNIEYFYAKVCVEDIRKQENIESFIIYQEKRYIKVPKEKAFDPYARYICITKSDTVTYDETKRWVNKITVKTLNGTGECIEIHKDGHKETYSRIFYNNGFFPQTKDEIIDKSGYILPQRRAELKRKAQALKAKHEKDKYLCTNNDEKIKELQSIVNEKRSQYAEMIKNETDPEKLYKIAQSFYYKFTRAAEAVQRFTENTNKQNYNSVEESSKAYTSAKNKLQEAI